MRKFIRNFFEGISSHTMDLILFVIFTTLVVFTIVIIWLFVQFQTIPDTLVTCVFGALAGECGIMGWIKTAKEKTKRETAHLDYSCATDNVDDDPLGGIGNE